MDLKELRLEIDKIDDELVKLFCQRMEVAAQIADYKKEQSLPILNVMREREKLREVAEKAGGDMQNYTRVLYSLLFELSRSYQERRFGLASALYSRITNAVQNTPNLFPQSPMVACQGVEGAYSQIACEKIFKNPSIFYFKSFDGVFTAIEKGLCQYGILPIENSTAGSVKKVYDLMIQHNFSVVRTCRLKVDHNLLAKRGAKMTVGRFNLFFNAALFVACWALYDLPTLIYSVLNTIFNAVSMDRAHRQSVTVQVLIFTKKDTQELGRYILENLHRGITRWEGRGVYTGEATHILCVCMNKYEIDDLREALHSIDPKAFFIVQEGVHVSTNFERRLS